jgi:hypothetical protein
MAKIKASGLRERAKKREQVNKWTCNYFSITDHRGNAAKLLRKVADSIDELGKSSVLDIVFNGPSEPSFKEITATVYFTFDAQT